MPELPEVQTVVNGLNASGALPGDLVYVHELREGTVHQRTAPDWPLRLTHASRRGKFILFHSESDVVILAHLRMTGKFTVAEPTGAAATHVRAVFEFAGGRKLWFVDPRTFGTIEILTRSQADARLATLGPEPLDKAFDNEYVHGKFSVRNASVKSLLLRQDLVAGLGNIYVCEILHEAGIDPRRAGKSLRMEDISRITTATKSILQKAIRLNGTTIDDFRRVDDKTGEFQAMLRVYGKKRCHCSAGIERIVQCGRGTWFCPICQK